jgi:uncharacterized membrane protein YGL010W
MIYWKHSFNFVIFGILSVWLFTLIKYIKTTQTYKLTDKDKKSGQTLLIISWILFVLGCIGALGALLEMVGVIHKEYKYNLI